VYVNLYVARGYVVNVTGAAEQEPSRHSQIKLKQTRPTSQILRHVPHFQYFQYVIMIYFHSN